MRETRRVSADPGIELGEEWVRDPASKAMVKRRAAEKSRGAAVEQWQLEKILEHGYGLATIYYGDIEPDFDGGMRVRRAAAFLQAGPDRAGGR